MLLVLLVSSLSLVLPDTTVQVTDGVAVSLVYVEPGVFTRQVEGYGPQAVTLSSGFWIGRYEVTWEQWRALMGWDDGRGQPQHPARRLSWVEAQAFLLRLSDAVDGWDFRLPTEAEWEWAARAGGASDTEDAKILRYAWIRENAGGVIQPVGTRQPNALGIYDMQGNVWEWVADWMAPYPWSQQIVDPAGPATGSERVRRGGSAVYGRDQASPSYRYQQPPTAGNGNLGFRIVGSPAARGTR